MLRHALTFIGLASTFFPACAIAQAVLDRSGPGQDCYQATILEPTPLHNQQAISACDKAVNEVKGGNNRAATLVNRADIRLRFSDYQGAVDDSEQGIALNPEIAVAYLNRGAGLIGLKRYAEAIPSLDKAIAMGTSRPQLAYFNRGIAKEAIGDIADAYHDYKMAFDLDPKFRLASDQVSRFRVITREDSAAPSAQ